MARYMNPHNYIGDASQLEVPELTQEIRPIDEELGF
jgi:hypothetical protein